MGRLFAHKRRLGTALLEVIAALTLASTTLAASSANYAINFAQIGAGGGETGQSANYHVATTIGQFGGPGGSANYHVYVGYRQAWGLGTPLPTPTIGGPTATQIPTVPPPPSATPRPTETPGGPTDTPTDTPTPTDPPPPTDTPGGPTPTDCPNPFVDIQSDIFYGAIHYLYCRHVVNGTDSSHFSPTGTSTRGQFAKVVVLGFGLSLMTPAGGSQDFSDVAPGYFAYSYIETGFHAGILSGFDANTCALNNQFYPCYLPNRPITRGQLTKLVVNAAHYPLFTPTGGVQTYTDVPSTNVFYVSIETAHNKGVINGYPDGTFRPNQNIQRDQMCQIVYKGVTTPLADPPYRRCEANGCRAMATAVRVIEDNHSLYSIIGGSGETDENTNYYLFPDCRPDLAGGAGAGVQRRRQCCP